jgi:hypothetical protein
VPPRCSTLDCLVESVADNDQIVLTLATYNVRGQLYAWLTHLYRANVKNYLVLCLDHQIHEELLMHGFNAYLGQADAAWEGTTRLLWVNRMQYILHLLRGGYEVVLSDLDAFWLKDPRPYLASFDEDMLLSRSHNLPGFLAKKFGSNACLGFATFRARPSTIRWMTYALRHLKGIFAEGKTIVDQVDFNVLLFKDKKVGTTWIEPMDPEPHHDETDGTTWLLLPQTHVLRNAVDAGPKGKELAARVNLHVLHIKHNLGHLPWLFLPEATRANTWGPYPADAMRAKAATLDSTVDSVCGKAHFSTHDQCAGIMIVRNTMTLALRTHLMECHAEHAQSKDQSAETRKCDASRLVDLLQMTKDETLKAIPLAKEAMTIVHQEKNKAPMGEHSSRKIDAGRRGDDDDDGGRLKLRVGAATEYFQAKLAGILMLATGQRGSAAGELAGELAPGDSMTLDPGASMNHDVKAARTRKSKYASPLSLF